MTLGVNSYVSAGHVRDQKAQAICTAAARSCGI